jgi:hypothetical protein
MMRPAVRCRICQAENKGEVDWYAVIGNEWEDRVRILTWTEDLSGWAGVYSACCAPHVQKLVAHWMATGSLNYPFTRGIVSAAAVSGSRSPRGVPDPWSSTEIGRQALGELAIDRESVNRAFLEDPESLATLLDAVGAVLSGAGIASPDACIPIEFCSPIKFPVSSESMASD